MKAQEKELIYNLLKKASDNFYGYSSPEFLNDNANFTDDSEQTKITHNKITIETINEKIKKCTNCDLCKTRTNTVPGMGVNNPVVLVIGEGPGEEEDKQGLPFVGPAGQLLDKMLAAISLDRNKNCYIANIVKCRPPMNRDPSPLESQACRAFLETQIHLLKPTMILAVGRVAAQNLLLTDESIGRLRGKFFELNNIPLMATYHPSALLRNVELKRPAWEDLKLFKSKLLELNPNYESTFN